ncbi:MAG: hypothetical protein HY040_22920 [Planctomycetes bacterium]|nr:hypothetical protein [Planctomycetota bacterium]
MLRVLFLMFLAVLIVVTVVAFNRKWVTFDWANKDDSKTEATVTVDRDKISEDVAAAKKSARQAFTPNAATIRGTVALVNEERLQVRTADLTTVTVRLTPATVVKRADQRINSGDLVVGEEVSIQTGSGSAGEEATSITVLPRP